MKYKVLTPFRDKETKEVYDVYSVVNFSSKRAKEIIEKLGENAIVEVAKTKEGD